MSEKEKKEKKENGISIYDAKGQIQIGKIASLVASMLLDGYEYDEIVSELHAATETALNSILEWEDEVRVKKEG